MGIWKLDRVARYPTNPAKVIDDLRNYRDRLQVDILSRFYFFRAFEARLEPKKFRFSIPVLNLLSFFIFSTLFLILENKIRFVCFIFKILLAVHIHRKCSTIAATIVPWCRPPLMTWNCLLPIPSRCASKRQARQPRALGPKIACHPDWPRPCTGKCCICHSTRAPVAIRPRCPRMLKTCWTSSGNETTKSKLNTRSERNFRLTNNYDYIP